MTLRAAWRSLSRAPGFAALVVITLAIGIGATTAMFSVVDAVLLRPLRFAGADRAVEVWSRTAEGASAQPGIAGLAFPGLREGLADVAAIEGYQFGSGTITGGTEPAIVSIPAVSPGLLHLIGASPILGRLFANEDAAPGSTSVLISDRTWTSQFARDPAVLGRRIAIDGEPHTVIGVLSNRVLYPEASAAVWKPLDLETAGQTRQRIQTVVVRRPAVSMEQLRARLAAITVAQQDLGTLTARQSLLFDDMVQVRVARNQGRPLWLVLGAVGLVLLIACANVTNLLLVRASNRRNELAVLCAVGADRATLMRHVAIEVAVLTGLGAIAGVAFAAALIRMVPTIVPEQLSYLTSTPADLNWRVISFAICLAGLLSLVAGLLPAWRSSRLDAIDALQWQSRSVAGSRDERWQGAMLAVQVGIVVVLLVGTGLLLRSLLNLTNVDPGYDAAALVAVSVELTSPRYQDAGVALAVMQDLERRVEGAGMGPATLTSGSPVPFGIRPEGEGGLPVDATGMVLPWTSVSPDHFDTLGIPVLQGRSFATHDGPDVMVVNDRLARVFWGEQSPIGRRFRLDADQSWRTVVGVVGDVRMMGLDDPTGHGMEFYVPHSRARAGGSYTLIARSPLAPGAVVPRIKELLWTLDPNVPVSEAGSVRDALLDSLYRHRFVLRLFTAFAVTALVLAGVGIYGVAAAWVARRRRDLAIRVAVGATGRHLVRLLFSRAAVVCTAGGVLGVAGAMASSRVLQSMLYETGDTDPAVLLATVLLTTALVVAACLVPARSAMSVDPLIILREQ